MDLGASIHYAGVSVKDVGAASLVDFDANFRGYLKQSKKIQLGLLARLGYRTGTWVPDSGNTEAVGLFNLAAGAGPVYRLGDSTVSLYGILKIRGATDADSKDQYLDVAIPEINLAFERPLTIGCGSAVVSDTTSSSAGVRRATTTRTVVVRLNEVVKP